jgi:hypothetical protein
MDDQKKFFRSGEKVGLLCSSLFVDTIFGPKISGISPGGFCPRYFQVSSCPNEKDAIK